MKQIIGTIVVVGTLFGGYLPVGEFAILVQPLEVLIICGGAFGAYIISNPGWVIKAGITESLGTAKPIPHTKEMYLELLGLMFLVFNKARREGLMSIEEDVEDPYNSELFNIAPKVVADHHATDFIADYLRLMISGASNPYQLEDLMIAELEAHHNEAILPGKAVDNVAQALPAFGIVAAVLGIIVTMSFLDQGPAAIAAKMSIALVGTFLGILVSYSIVGPLATALNYRYEAQSAFFVSIKACLMANLHGYAPPIAVEFGRKSIPSRERPTFAEVDEYLQSLK